MKGQFVFNFVVLIILNQASIYSSMGVIAGKVSDEVDSILNNRGHRTSKMLNSDPETKALTMSPYELSTFADLVMHISMFRCPHASRPAMRSIRSFTFKVLTKAPQKNGVAHPLFYPTYRGLVSCMDYAEQKYSGKYKGPVRRRRSTVSQEINNLVPKSDEDFERYTQRQQGSKQTPTIAETDDSFPEFFGAFYSIVEKTCPPTIRINYSFLGASLREAVDYFDIDDSSVLAHEKYFGRNGLLKQIQKCDKLIQDSE